MSLPAAQGAAGVAFGVGIAGRDAAGMVTEADEPSSTAGVVVTNGPLQLGHVTLMPTGTGLGAFNFAPHWGQPMTYGMVELPGG